MRTSACIALALGLALPALALADKPEANPNIKLATGEPERCLGITRIKELKILDKRNVLFYTTSNEVYLNDLSRPCPGLRPRDTVMYRTSLHELCNVDIITVLDDVGSGYMPGTSCSLGSFYPISKDDAAKLRKESRQ